MPGAVRAARLKGVESAARMNGVESAARLKDAAALGPGLLLHRGTRAVQRRVEFAPSTGGLAPWAHHRDVDGAAPHAGLADAGSALRAINAQTPVLYPDGHTLFYRPGFAALALPEQAGRVAHAVLHIALRHVPRFAALQALTGDADLRLFNVCADAIVNSALGHLGWLQLPANAEQLDILRAQALGQPRSVASALLGWDVERLHRAIDDRRPVPQPPVAGKGQRDRGKPDGADPEGASADSGHPHSSHPYSSHPRSGHPRSSHPQNGITGDGKRADGPRAARARAPGGATATDLLPGSPAGPASLAAHREAPEAEAALALARRERLLRAHAGDGDFSMLRALLADLPHSRPPWARALRSQLALGLSQRPGLSWSRRSRSCIANPGRGGSHRRMPWEPGTRASRRVPRLALVVDVSGSVGDALLARFACEIDAISRRQEAALVLIVGDDRVRRVVHIQPRGSGLLNIRSDGRGGTDFTPLLEEAQRHQPDITVVLTDLDGPARFQPRCPVIWAVQAVATMPVHPFGRLLARR